VACWAARGGKGRAAATVPRARISSPLRRSLRISIAEGILAEVIGSCSTGAVLTGWAVLLGCSPLQVGILSALPFLSQALQLPSAWITSALGRRRMAVVAVTAQRELLLFLAPLPFLSISLGAKQALLLGVAGASAASGVVGNNAWTAWMGELVPSSIRGRYFGQRTAICTAGGSLAGLAFGVLLDRSGHGGGALSVLAVIASVAGIATGFLLARQHEPPGPACVPDLASAMRPFADLAVRDLLVFQVAWNAAVGCGGSFFYLHLLRNLHAGYTRIAMYAAGVAAARMLSAPVWGRAIDRLGARPVLAACSFVAGVMPFTWILASERAIWPIAIDALVGGAALGGHGLATFAMPLAVTPRSGRPFYLAAFSMAGGLGYALGAAVGGVVAGALPERIAVLGHVAFRLEVLFVLSGVARLAAGRLSLRIRERGAGSVWQLHSLARQSVAEMRERVEETVGALLRGV
jgi:MFS family permease